MDGRAQDTAPVERENTAELDQAITSALKEPIASAEFGQETPSRLPQQSQGQEHEPSGAALPDLPSSSEVETAQTEEQASEFEPGIINVAERFQDGDSEGVDAALRVADKAKMRGSNDEAVLDALEAAETAYDSAHLADTAAPGSMSRRLSVKMEAGRSPPGRQPSRKGLVIEEASRAKIRAKMLAALQRNALLASLPAEQQEAHVLALEAACQTSSSSRPVYISKAGNVARQLARATASELEELPRVAAGVVANSSAPS